MILAAHIWKEELNKELREFTVFLDTTKAYLDDYLDLRVEKFFFVSAFLIRKLNEAHTLSDQLIANSYICERYPRININATLNIENKDSVHKFYNLTHQEQSSLKFGHICNLLIHSFIFSPVFAYSGKFFGVLFNSDKIKNRWLYWIEANTFCNLVSDVIQDDIVYTNYDRKTKKFIKSRIPSANRKEDM
jgi:hypothetical protein